MIARNQCGCAVTLRGENQNDWPSNPGGITTTSETPKNIPSSEGSGTESGTVYTDRELAAIVERWPKLPEHIRKTIVGIVQCSG